MDSLAAGKNQPLLKLISTTWVKFSIVKIVITAPCLTFKNVSKILPSVIERVDVVHTTYMACVCTGEPLITVISPCHIDPDIRKQTSSEHVLEKHQSDLIASLYIFHVSVCRALLLQTKPSLLSLSSAPEGFRKAFSLLYCARSRIY